MNQRSTISLLVLAGISGLALSSYGQVTRADYDRALNLQKKYEALPLDLTDNVFWLSTGDRFVYRKSVEGGHEFVIVDAATQARQPAFDHAKLAAALSTASGDTYTALTLPFARFHFADNDSAIDFEAENTAWHCDIHAWTCHGHPLFSGDDYGYDDTPKAENSADKTLPSPDGKWLAYILNYNVQVRSKDRQRQIHPEPGRLGGQLLRLLHPGLVAGFHPPRCRSHPPRQPPRYPLRRVVAQRPA